MHTLRYIPRTLSTLVPDGERVFLSEDNLLQQGTPAVVLGEPGMGKTELLKRLSSQNDGLMFVRASALIRNPGRFSCIESTLIVDGLDEVAALTEGDPLHNVLAALASAGSPEFVLSCRSADWRNTSSKASINDDYGKKPIVWRMEPISQEQSLGHLIESGVESAIAERLVTGLEAQGLKDLLGNPLTLNLLVALTENNLGEIPVSRSELFQSAVDVLWREGNAERTPSGLALMSKEDAIKAAGAACALLMITGKSCIRIDHGSAGESDLLLADISYFEPKSDIQNILNSRLFQVADESGEILPLHRTIAEFLGARWLAGKTASKSSERRVSRVLSMISVDGMIPASLRGLHAWLALYPKFTEQILNADPYGVLKYGDPSKLSSEASVLLIDALERLQTDDPYFRAGDWDSYTAASIKSSAPLVEKFRSILSHSGDGFHLRSLLLELIHGTSLSVTLSDVLITLMSDEARYYAERLDAGQALVAQHEISIPWHEEIDQFRQGNADSSRLAVELLTAIGVEKFDPEFIGSCVLSETGFGPSPRDRRARSISGTLWKLRTMLNTQMIIGVLDTIADGLEKFSDEDKNADDRWENWYELASFTRHLITRILQESSISPVKLWRWLSAFAANDYYNQKDIQEIDLFFKEHDDARRGVIRQALQSNEVQKYGSLFAVTRIASSLHPTDEDIEILFSELEDRGLSGEADRKILKALYGAVFRNDAVREQLYPRFFKLAEDDEELLRYLDPEPSEQEKRLQAQEKKFEDRRKRQERELLQKRDENRRLFAENISELEAGELRWVAPAAKVYFGLFSDVNRELSPIERVAEWLGSDLAQACLRGFEATLHRNDIPTASEVAKSYAGGKYWHYIHPILAGLSERLEHSSGLVGVNPDVIRTGWYGALGELLDGRNGIESLADNLLIPLADDPSKFELTLREWFEPHFAAKNEHITGIYALAREERFSSIAWKLALDWLNRFSDMSYSNAVELVGAAIYVPQANKSTSWNELKSLASAKLRDDAQSSDLRLLWTAILFLVAFDEFLMHAAVDDPPDKNLLWAIRRIVSYDRTHSTVQAELSSEQLAWIIRSMREQWPQKSRPEGTTSGDKNPWDASQFIQSLITSLAQRTETEAIMLLAETASRVDGYRNFIKAAIADQKRLLIERRFSSATIESIKHALEDTAPSNISELQAVVVAEFQSLQKRIRGDSVNSVSQFYTDSGVPRIETDCRDRAVSLLQLPFGIKWHIEEAMPKGKRADAGFHFGEYRLPLEAKGQWNKELWTAATDQLDQLYTVDHFANDRGIYLVFWFGRKAPQGRRLRLPPKDEVAPTTALEMKELLERRLPAGRRDQLSIVVLDLENGEPTSDG